MELNMSRPAVPDDFTPPSYQALFGAVEAAWGRPPNEHNTGPLNYLEFQLLRCLVANHRPTQVLEVGRGLGFSTLALVEGLLGRFSYLTSYDHGPPGDTPLHEVLQTLLKGQAIGVQLKVGSSPGCLDQHTPGSFDMAFIDADHSYDGVKKDTVQVKRLVAPGGLAVYHDCYHPDWTEGIHRALKEDFGDRVLFLQTSPVWATSQERGDGFAIVRL